MKKIFTLLFLFHCFSSSAQLTQLWVNNFCCFDSVQPHTFSFPMGTRISGDTLNLSFYEDGFLNIMKIDLNNGSDIQLQTFTTDTIESPFYFGGGSAFYQNNIISSAMKYNQTTGDGTLWLSSFDNSLINQWNKYIDIPVGRICKPVIFNPGADFFVASISDSLRVFRITVNGANMWKTSLAVHNPANRDPEIFIANNGAPVVIEAEHDTLLSPNCTARFFMLDPLSGSTINSFVLDDSLKDGFQTTFVNSILKIAGINCITNNISLIDIDLTNFQNQHHFNSGIQCVSEITKFSYDSISHNSYLNSFGSFYAFDGQDSLLFNSTIPNSSYEQYDMGDFNFDTSGNIIFSFSFNNSSNNPVNDDLKTIIIDPVNGNILEQIDYNSPRNTSEIYLSQFLHNGYYYVIYATDFDNFAILHEETQLGMIKYAFSLVAVPYLNGNAINLFPNPVSIGSMIHLEGMINSYSEFSIYDVNGRRIKTFTNQTSIDIDNSFQPGVYILQFSDNEKKVSREKIIIN